MYEATSGFIKGIGKSSTQSTYQERVNCHIGGMCQLFWAMGCGSLHVCMFLLGSFTLYGIISIV